MADRVAIVGLGQTALRDADDERLYHEHDYEAARLALADAGLERGDVDTVLCSGWDAVDGRTISDMHTAMSAGGYLKDSSHVGEDGVMALAYAYLRIASGAFDVAVVFDPLFQRPLGPSHLVSLAMQAGAYAHHFGVSEERAAGVTVRARAQGAANPRAHLRSPVSLEDVLSSEPLCHPLRALHWPPQSVGGVAVVLASEGVARRIRRDPVWISGIAWAIDGYDLGSKELWGLPGVAAAAGRAYGMAGVESPSEEFDVVELHGMTPYHEMMAGEALGLAAAGEGGSLPEDGRPAVNPSGGVACGNLYGASGLVRVFEAALQLRGEAGPVQVADCRRALAHGMSAPSGAAARTDCVVVMEGS